MNIVFIHINKTGGLSIKNALAITNPVKKRHLTAIEMKKIIGEDAWKNSFKFSFVRNPWDKVVSHYSYRLLRNETNIRQENISFGDWVKLTYKNQDLKYYNYPLMFSPQVDWLVSENGEIEMDFIGRFENLEHDFETLTGLLKLDSKLPHLNASTRENYRDYYDAETREIVRKCFEKDISYFNYEF